MHIGSLVGTRIILWSSLTLQITAQEDVVFSQSQPSLDVPPLLPPPPPPPAPSSSSSSSSSSSGSLLSRAFQSLAHALDPVPDGFDAHVAVRPELPSESSSSGLPPGSTNQEADTDRGHDPSVPGGRAPVGAWAWVNYTRPAEEIWPQCSSLPNCLKFSSEKGCDKWKSIANYPVIVGDMDGSGSRGITWLLRAGGVWMRTTNEWLDWARDEHPLSNALMQATHSLDYKFSSLPKDLKARAVKQATDTIREFANVGQTQLGKWNSRQLKPWEVGLDRKECPRRMGWKHGPTLFLQPVYEHVMGGRHTFVHIIRDGRDMAFSRNRNNLAKYPKFGGQVVGLFKLGKKKTYNHCFYKPNEHHSAEKDRECIVMQMRVWEKMNLGAARFGQREMGLRYVPVRVEDLILPDERTRAETIWRFFKRIGVGTVDTTAKAQELSQKIFSSASLKSHFSIARWGGCNPAIIDEVEAAGAEGLAHFGYSAWRTLREEQKKQGIPESANSCSVGISQIQVPGSEGLHSGEANTKRKKKGK